MTLINNKQQQMIDFESSWYSLGGGSSREINEQFGLSDRDFFAELNQIVSAAPPRGMTNAELRRMREVIRRRLWMAR